MSERVYYKTVTLPPDPAIEEGDTLIVYDKQGNYQIQVETVTPVLETDEGGIEMLTGYTVYGSAVRI